jgi:NADH-quinone oxidoreductase subunit L
MFVAVGVGAYSSGIFHVMTHSFFKACLFLGAGSVIHALHEEQDIRRMGGLLKHMPVTGITFLAAWLAICGVPPFAGFFSKDEILWKTLSTPNAVVPWMPFALYGVLLFTALLTAFYMTRLVVMTFFGEFRGGRAAMEKIHESPKSMTIPLVALAVGSLASGWVGVPEAVGGSRGFEKYLETVFHGSSPEADIIPLHLEPLFMVLSILVAVLGIGLAFNVYFRKHTYVVDETERRIPRLRDVLVNKFWVDELYDATVLAFVRFLSRWVSFWFIDRQVIERVVAALAVGVRALGRLATRLATGSVRWALAGMVLGAALLLYWWIR